jgi:hypothetical protein
MGLIRQVTKDIEEIEGQTIDDINDQRDDWTWQHEVGD